MTELRAREIFINSYMMYRLLSVWHIAIQYTAIQYQNSVGHVFFYIIHHTHLETCKVYFCINCSVYIMNFTNKIPKSWKKNYAHDFSCMMRYLQFFSFWKKYASHHCNNCCLFSGLILTNLFHYFSSHLKCKYSLKFHATSL